MSGTDMLAPARHDASEKPSASASWGRHTTSRALVVQVVFVILAVGAWELIALRTSPLVLPSPSEIVGTTLEISRTGELWESVRISYARVLVGWALGFLLGVPLGLFAGRIEWIRTALEPFINLFRFIPPIAFITLFLIWLGLGEASKISLIIYSTFFVVFLNTVAGVQRVHAEKVRAAQSLGASRAQVLRTVIVPASVPDIVTGGRIAMGNSFMTVVAAELIAAESGVGFMIMNARLFARTDKVFVGIVALGIMGLLADLVFRVIVRRVAYRYDLKF